MRTDIHRPSAIEPSEYEFVAWELQNINAMEQVYLVNHYRQLIKDHMAATGGKFSQHKHGGNCHICGALSETLAVYYHHMTNSYIRVGHICAEKMDMATDGGYNNFKNAVRKEMEFQKGIAAAERYLSQRGLQNVFEFWRQHRTEYNGNYYEKMYREGKWEKEEGIVMDMVKNLVRYGSLSGRQEDFLRKLMYNIEHRPQVKAQREAERAMIPDCPSGRLQIAGEVVSVKMQDEFYNSRLVMTVKTKEGWLAWGSVPATLCDIQKGEHVEFMAQIIPSAQDPKFGFFKRPTKAKRVGS